MNADSFVATVKHVLPALNIDPGSFHVDEGFVTRALRSGKPRSLTLDNINTQIVFMGSLTTVNLDTDILVIAGEALESIPSYEYCQQLIVVWLDSNEEMLAAALNVSSNGKPLSCLGRSWINSEEWNVPTINPQRSNREALDDALNRMETAIKNNNLTQIERAYRLVNQCLLLAGGEGQSMESLIEPYSTSWETSFNHYKLSIDNEWSRINESPTKTQFINYKAHINDRLNGLKIFISYARPEAVTLAWPVRDALLSCGAEVWFDHEEICDKRLLDSGLAETIASCDAYVLCASDEFFERAGYATQELSWALDSHGIVGRPSRFLVVTRSIIVLPSIIHGWPQILLNATSNNTFSSKITEILELEPSPTSKFSLSKRIRHEKPTLPEKLDGKTLQLRAKHVRVYDWFNINNLENIFSNDINTKQSSEMVQHLLSLKKELEWNGTLRDLECWPVDPLIRDIRFRIASVRAVANTRWPLTGKLEEDVSICKDVEYLSTIRPVVINWPIVIGWDDFDRRLALRHHAGLLRILQELLRRGLYGGLLSVPSSKIEEWESQLTIRRTECYDEMLLLRASGAVGWQNELPTWDRLFRSWSKYLISPKWEKPVPSDIQLLITSSINKIAAAAADTGWYASRYGYGAQRFTINGYYGFTSILIFSSTSGSFENTEAAADIKLSIIWDDKAGYEIRIFWAAGESLALAPNLPKILYNKNR